MENNEEYNVEPQNSINLNKEQKTQDEFQSRIDMIDLRENLNKVKTEIAKVIVGQENMVEHLLAALLSNGHVLIEGVPGVAKTITAKLLSKNNRCRFQQNSVYTGSDAFRYFGDVGFQHEKF